MKPWYRSVTIWSALIAVLGLVITRIASGKSIGEIVTDPEVQSGTADLIGFLLSALGAAGVLYGRVTASSAIAPLVTKRSDESGRAGIPLLAALATLGLLPLLAWLTSSRELKTFQTQWIGDRPPRGSVFRMAFLGWVRVTESGPASLTVQRCSRLVSGWLGIVRWMRARGALSFAALAVAVVAIAVVLLGGCAWQTRRDGETFELRLRPDPARPKPACLYRWTLDGELVLEGAVADCPEVPACREVAP